MSVGHFHIPGAATRREYAAYVMIAQHRQSGKMHLYVGKTGDNKDGCNPVISRAGNHFSYNTIHSQMRNKLPTEPEEYDFDFFYATFGAYVPPRESRDGIDMINEMERWLNELVRKEHGQALLNPYLAKTKLRKIIREQRTMLRTSERQTALLLLVQRVAEHVAKYSSRGSVVVESDSETVTVASPVQTEVQVES